MYKNIKHNNVRGLALKLRSDKYYDFMLYRGEVVSSSMGNECVVADIAAENFQDGKIYSTNIWENAINNGVELQNIGFTGIDNGLISYRRDKITNAQFLDIFVNSSFSIEKEDNRFFVFPVTGNSNQYKYYYDIEENDIDGKYLALKGGFLQGFFKLHGYDYQTLPDVIEDEWNFEFVLRKKNYDVEHRTLNSDHENNKGMFFYLGTRAENKFWYLYKKHQLTDALFKGDCDGNNYFLDYKPTEINVTRHDYIMNEKEDVSTDEAYNSKCGCKCNKYKSEKDDYAIDGYFSDETCDGANSYFDDSYLQVSCGGFKLDQYTLNRQNYLDFSLCCGNDRNDNGEIGECIIDGYFSDDYVIGSNNRECDCNEFIFDENYFEKEMSLENLKIKTSNGYDIDKKGYFEILTSNKFLTFDRTKYGFTTKTYDENNDIIAFEGRKDWKDVNYYTLMNRTSTGYTTKNIIDYHEANQKPLDIYDDIKENSFALKINDDGSIGYRYGVTDCDSETKFSIMEETSKPNIIHVDEWATINVRIFLLNSAGDKCNSNVGKRKMKLFIYVNGKLVLISQELPEFRLRELNELSDKQEGVPYNISIGGGTQGLADAIWLDYYHKANYLLPLEEYFCGTFLGDVKSFKFYNCFREYNNINNSVFKV